MSLYGFMVRFLYGFIRVRSAGNSEGPQPQGKGRDTWLKCHATSTPCSDIASHTAHSSHHTCTPTARQHCSLTAAASHPLPSRRGLACASPARRRGVLLLQVCSRSAPGLLVHVVGEGGPAGPHLARLLLGVVRELQPQAALGAARRRADGPALGGESRGLVRG